MDTRKNPVPLVPGEPIPVGTSDRLGPVSIALWNIVVGATDCGDLFVVAGPHSPRRGLFVLSRTDTTPDSVPVFAPAEYVETPFGEDGPQVVGQHPDGGVYALRLVGGELLVAPYNPERLVFERPTRPPSVIPSIPERSTLVGARFAADGALQLYLSVSDKARYRPPEGPNGRDPDYRPYDGAGIWTGELPYAGLWTVTLADVTGGPAGEARQLSTGDRETVSSFVLATHVDLGSDGSGLVAAGRAGSLFFYPDSDNPAPRRSVSDGAGIVVRTRAILAGGAAYPRPDGTWSDIITGAEGALQHYRFAGELRDGNPVYSDPAPILVEQAELHTGSLPVLTAVDWDGDGTLDIVAGNSEGRILFLRNAGTNHSPQFENGVPLTICDGYEIHVQAGYRGSIQGPMELRWGYVCPTVVDWDGDGLPDIVMGDITGVYTVYLNRGTPTAPKLEQPRVLHCDGMPVHGTWRVQPGIATLDDPEGGSRLAFVTLDDDDQFHLYRQIDVENVEDAGKLHLTDGSPIGANFLYAGGTGRSKIVLADWDRDGRTDLIVGTPRHGSVPDHETGLPQSEGLPGSAVLFLRNVGTDSEPVFERPRLMRFRGEPIYLGQHACSPAVWDIGDSDGPDLIVGNELGRIRWYPRKELSW